MKSVKLTWVALAVLLVPALLTACDSADLGTPEGAAEAFFDAYENEDEDAAKEALCERHHEELVMPDDLEGVLSDLDEVEFDFDLQFHESDEDIENGKLVEAYGRVRLRFVNDDRDVEFKQHSRDDAPLFVVTVVEDGDDWQVCDVDAASGSVLFPPGNLED